MEVKHLIKAALCSGLILVTGACSSTKDITYFQDLYPGAETAINNAAPLRLQPNDKITIIVSTSDPRLNTLFNLPVSRNQVGQQTTTSSGNGDVAPYTIDHEGDIYFPVLGKLHIGGMTREQVAEFIRRQLISRELAKDPIVTVDYLNLSVSVMGEVTNPGRVPINREDFTILDALSSAGDLTIYGKRDKVMVLREENGMQKTYVVNLNSGKDLTQSPVYYMQQNDVIYVEPNQTKARQSTPNGNVWSTPTLWISMASLALTIALCFIK
ncbi:MAG: polysaccharide biosynthesis/export family protein [Candidatus Amulumruptor caecigallinarius]|nr:polysaccharide biosynthesis/export family protein [Candidatus Amulumruptor caecigallinarius]